jgi:hypothetical protein
MRPPLQAKHEDRDGVEQGQSEEERQARRPDTPDEPSDPCEARPSAKRARDRKHAAEVGEAELDERFGEADHGSYPALRRAFLATAERTANWAHFFSPSVTGRIGRKQTSCPWKTRDVA